MRNRRAQPLSPLAAFIFGAFLAVALALALFPVFPRAVQVDEGDTASRTWVAPRDFSFESAVLTEKQREQAAAEVPDVLVFSADVRSQQLAALDTLVADVDRVRESDDITRSQKLSALLGTENLLAPGFEALILDMPGEQWQRLTDEAKRVLQEVFSVSVPRGQESLIAEELSQRVDASFSSDEGMLVELLIKPLIVSNLEVDPTKTEEARNAAREAVVPVRVSFTKGQTIVRNDEIIDSTAVEALREADLLSPHLEWNNLTAVLLISLVTAGVLGYYIYAFQPLDRPDYRRLLLLVVLTALAALVAKLSLPLVFPDDDRHFLAYALPLAAVPMLVAALLEARLAVVLAAVLAALVTFLVVYLPDISAAVTSGPLDVLRAAGVYGVGGAVGALAVYRAERLNRYLLAGVLVSAASFLMLTAVWLIDVDRRAIDFPWLVLVSAVNGLASGVLAAGAFVTLGSLFGITTRVQLMELAQLNQPLLRRLQDEAPGTFHHSIILGNLAERAADLIGADALLVRVGCYFHDVGKLRQPGYFIENQLSGTNPHDKLSFRASAQIVRGHVEDGLELARENGLPPQVRDFIAQHHGAGQVTYFYRRAVESEEDVDSSHFSYPGPKPQTREVAIAMLADSVEAAIRASADRSPERIDALVDEVVAQRLNEGQLDESDLTLREIKIVSESFKSGLRGVYHPRLEYPEAKERPKSRIARGIRFRPSSWQSPSKTRR